MTSRGAELLELLAAGRTLLVDGSPSASPTTRRLVGPGAALAHPQELAAAHREHVEAGARAVHTHTATASDAALARAGLASRATDLFEAAVAAARAARPAFVIGAIGAGDAFGDVTSRVLSCVSRARWLASAGVDALHLTACPEVEPAAAAVAAVAELGLPVLATHRLARRGARATADGVEVGAALGKLADAGAAAVGACCGLTSSEMRELAAALAASGRWAVAGRPPAPALIFLPDAAQPRRARGHIVCWDQAPESFADDGLAMVASGARILGGCCGVDPTFIASLSGRLIDIR